MFSKFFIYRPIFATVVAIVIILAGLASMRNLAIEEYPKVVPPQVSVSTNYPGASAETISKTVASPLEQAINGVDNMIYISSSSASDGSLRLNVFFEIGTDPDDAVVDVNNKVQAALTKLPDEVQDFGVTVTEKSTSILEVITLYSEGQKYAPLFLSNYALINVVDDLKRIEGVGDVFLFGGKDYSIRIWLKPDVLAKYSLTPSDVIKVVREQNSQFAAGQIGAEPIGGDSAFTYTITTKGRFTDPSEFSNIIIRSNSDGSSLKIRDVATVELGSQTYNFSATMDGNPSIAIGIFLQSGANALATADAVNARMEKIAAQFPDSVKYEVPYNTTKFVRISIQEVIKTFIEAMLLVTIVVYFFLQNIRATIIPILAVPVSIIGTFAGFYMLGFSINLLTLFALILAIGIVVDDAIIVIENVERTLREKNMSVKEATIHAMHEVTSPIIAIVLVLSAVFLPVTFMGGFTGQMYKQFATTIVVSVGISGLVALSLTPALCAIFLKEHEPKPFWIVRKFNEFFDFLTFKFQSGVKMFIKLGIVTLILFLGLGALGVSLLQKVPTGLVPMEDKGFLMVIDSLPPASSLKRTEAVRDTISETMRQNPNVAHVIGLAGFDIVSFAMKTSSGISFVPLKDWDLRPLPSQHSQALAGQFMGQFMANRDAFIFPLSPPPIMGLSMTGGFEMYVQDRTGGSIYDLSNYVNEIVQKANARPELTMVRSTLDVRVPQYEAEVDREKAKSLGVSITDVFSTMQSTFGAYYVNDFNMYGKTFKVNIQSDMRYRENPNDLKDVFVRNSEGKLIPLSTLITMKKKLGADIVERFNLFPAAKVLGEPKPGFSSGDALRAIEECASEVLPEGYTVAWAGTSYQEKEVGDSSMNAFIFGIVMVFLILAAQYERWLVPLAVVTAVPFAVLGAVLAIWLRGIENDIYFQIGLVTLIGLSAKNAILIVEFAMQRTRAGVDLLEATIEASKLRFRPIVMTSLAFTIGVLPLALSSGAGAASRHAIGTGVIGGMILATFVATFFVPFFYYYLEKFSKKIFTKIRGAGHE